MSQLILGVCVCMCCLFLVAINNFYSAQHLSAPASSSAHPPTSANGSTTVVLPPAVPVIERSFGPPGGRLKLFQDLTALCHAANGRSDPCYGHHTPTFLRFLRAQRAIYNATVGNSYRRGRRRRDLFATPDEWDARCQAQVSLRDGREASACAAAAYVAIPYPLSEGLAATLDDRPAPPSPSQTPRPQQQAGNVSAAALALLAVTVVSTYEPVDTVSRSITFQSACLHGLPLHVLGVGAGTPFPPGLKIAQFTAFLERIPARDRDHTVVLFVDGFDVLFQAGPAAILQRFLQTGKRLLFGGDHSCFPFKYWPDNAGGVGEWLGPCTGACSNSRYVCDTLFPRPPGAGAGVNDPTNRWLNSGGIVGYASAFLEVLDALRGLPPGFVTAFPGADQAVYAALYLSRAFAGTVAVDHGSEVFLSFGLSRDPAEAPATRVKDPQNLLVRLPPAPLSHRREQHGHQSNLLGDVRWANTYYYRPLTHFTTASNSSNRSSSRGDEAAAQAVPAVVHFNGEDGKHALRRLQELMLPHVMRHSKRHVMYWVAWATGWGRGSAATRAKDRMCAATVTPHPVVSD